MRCIVSIWTRVSEYPTGVLVHKSHVAKLFYEKDNSDNYCKLQDVIWLCEFCVLKRLYSQLNEESIGIGVIDFSAVRRVSVL